MLKHFITAIIFLLFSFNALAGEKMSDKDIKKNIEKLDELQYKVTQENGTEPAFRNEYWDHKDTGIYVDIVSGEALFSSKDKFNSGTGWPSFSKAIPGSSIERKTDTSFGMERTEVRSGGANSHLGHLFNDGPTESGDRYCINSAALRFVALSDMKKQGYGDFLYIFGQDQETTKGLETAILAGGCFWGMEELLKDLDGVVETQVGYTGGKVKNPIYKIVSAGFSGHAESVKVTFDPKKISYEEILKYFFRIHNPTTRNQQGNDRGTQYRSAIFYLDEQQKNIAFNVINQANRSGVFEKDIVTKIVKAGDFADAEEYHQDYLDKNPRGYTCHFIRDEWKF